MEQQGPKHTDALKTGQVKGGMSTPKIRVHSRYILPSDRYSFAVHFDVLRRFVALSRNGTEPIAAGKVVGEGVPLQSASINVRFLTDVGLLDAKDRGQYVPTMETVRFVNALSVSPERAKPILKALIERTWFADIAKSIMAAKSVMTESEFLGELAIAAETDKSKKEPALRVLLEYLLFTGIITRDERGLSLSTTVAADASSDSAKLLTFPESTPIPKEDSRNISEWHVIQTEDFYLKTKSDQNVIDDIKEYLKLLERKIQRTQDKKKMSDLVLPMPPIPR
jgi:hypothetical protein